MEASSRRLDYISVLNVLSAFGVVALHCNHCFWEGPAQGHSWLTANFIETFFYWPVPIFFMMSGATLLNYRERMVTGEYFKRRFKRTVAPFLVWSLIGLAYCIFRGKQIDLSPQAIVSGILNTKYVSVYWFFLPLFAAYLSIPILSAINEKEEVYSYAAVLGVIFVSALPLACSLLSIKWNSALTPPPVMGYLLFVILGWLLSRKEIGPRQRLVIYIFAIVGWLVHMFGTFAVSSPDAGVVKTFKGYLNLPSVLQAIGVFVFIRYACEGHPSRTKWITRICKKIAPLTFGVYLTHWYVLDIIRHSGSIPTHSIVFRTLGAVLVFCACAGATWLYKHGVALVRTRLSNYAA